MTFFFVFLFNKTGTDLYFRLGISHCNIYHVQPEKDLDLSSVIV